MNQTVQNDVARLILRLMLGGMLLFHGIDKVIHGTSFISHLLAQHHLPEWLLYGVFVGEVLAPLMLIIGKYVRVFSLVIATNMLFAIVMVYKHTLFTLGQHGAWNMEVPMFYLLSALALMLLGAGKYRLLK